VRCARERKRNGLNIIEDKMASPSFKIERFRTATKAERGGRCRIKKRCKNYGNVMIAPKVQIWERK
jgi:hypothetical protein